MDRISLEIFRITIITPISIETIKIYLLEIYDKIRRREKKRKTRVKLIKESSIRKNYNSLIEEMEEERENSE